MLAEPKQPIAEISRAAGYTSPNRMCEVFRREVGMTPSAYRKQILGEGEAR